MNKLFIGLLIIAAGAGIFFYLRQQDKPTPGNALVKEQIIGSWKLESMRNANDSIDAMVGLLSLLDSNLSRYHCEFTKDGSAFLKLNDSITDSYRYEWKDDDHLIWKQNKEDTTGDVFSVLTLNKDSLQLRDSDSTLMVFSKRQ